ncbi:MAG: hypothetical protein ACOH2K_00685 [Burkholderiaceae bacterium]
MRGIDRQIGCGYENGNDSNNLRHDPMFKIAIQVRQSKQRVTLHLPRLPGKKIVAYLSRAPVRRYPRTLRQLFLRWLRPVSRESTSRP